MGTSSPSRNSKIVARLPDRPSHLIRVSLLDISECERDRRYVVDDPGFWDRRWHEISRSGQTCRVCIAGTVMAKSCLVPWGESHTPEDFDTDTKKKLMAINEFRLGGIHTALVHILEFPSNPLEVERRITPYSENKRLFYNQMHRLADDLEIHGL